ncbi:enoyl-CoA hydratase/isomerase family protein [Streptomyces albipurpureus]|uniref:Enoyl-CoA hydratase-related protein n=1 Tax=Streptomyces albipurpureus TaxID=2897419 RepID=A0ABT0UGK2_9ACTN|nr:enoyl-CoA hydratase-related protein [Streptomyces sp. CWNU-1]MCM2387570.1 enoyl-CoA hydratase-related protein [Streptomyces sp. CWNU-1]
MDSSDFTCVDVRRDGFVLHVVLDNPRSDMNAIDRAMHDDLTKLFRMLKQESQARVVLLSGRGRAFSVGGDFEWFRTLRSPHALAELNRDAKQLIWDMLDVEIPIVTAVHGYAMGLGTSIALYSDVIFMAESAKIADPHVKAGIVAGDGGVVAWPMAVGPARAKEFLMTGDALTAAAAERLGLVNHVVPDAELEERALAFARRLAEGAPMAVRFTKMAVNKLVKQALGVAFDASTGYELLTFMSEDHVEAVDAFLEKRQPRFTGR